MPVLTQTQGTKTLGLTLGTLGSGAYLASGTIDLTVAIPLELSIEAEAIPNGVPTGNLQLVVFVETSLDGTNFTGPATRATANDGQETFVGLLPMAATTAVRNAKAFSTAGLPVTRYFRFVAKNDMGVPLASGTINYGVIKGDST